MSEKRKSVVEVHAPVLGIITNTPRNIMEPRSQPWGNNANLYYGINQKEFGTSLWATGSGSVLGAPVSHLQELQYTNGRTLQVLTSTGVYKYTGTADSFISDGQVFTGTWGDYWSGVQYNEAFLYTNGVNPIQYKASLGATGTNLGSAVSPTTYKAWCIQPLKEHLNLYHVFENGTEYSKRVQWTKKSPLTYSAGTTDFSSGTAGAIDLPDVEGEIKTAVPLGGNIAVFADQSIHTQTYVGGDEIYRFSKTVSGIGTPSRRGAVSRDNAVYFISENNVYAYLGGDDLRAIGDPVRKEMFAELNNVSKEHIWTEYDAIYDKVLFHIPTGTATSCDVAWVYDLTTEAWSRIERNHTACTEYSRKDSITIGELTGNIGAQNFSFASLEGAQQSRVQLYGDPTGRVLKRDFTRHSLTISGTAAPQTYVYETPDFTGTPQKDENGSKVEFLSTRQRWLQATIWACGEGLMLVECTTDGGRSYAATPQSPFTLDANGSPHQVSLQKRSPSLALRVSNTGTNDFIGLEYVKVEFIPGNDNA
jgi:hypothetical protein